MCNINHLQLEQRVQKLIQQLTKESDPRQQKLIEARLELISAIQYCDNLARATI
jgi:hypothetical protein